MVGNSARLSLLLPSLKKSQCEFIYSENLVQHKKTFSTEKPKTRKAKKERVR